jgi:hypothetical protein
VKILCSPLYDNQTAVEDDHLTSVRFLSGNTCDSDERSVSITAFQTPQPLVTNDQIFHDIGLQNVDHEERTRNRELYKHS